MKIAWLLESTVLCGGVKVVFRHAEGLHKRGHTVAVISPEPYPAWFSGRVPFIRGDLFDRKILSGFDRIIGTTPGIVTSLFRCPELRDRVWHLVQGYEADYTECVSQMPLIASAYSLPVPKMTVSSRLSARLSEIYPGGAFHTVGQGIETGIFYREPAEPDRGSREVDRIFLVGPLSISIKQIAKGLSAFRRVRQSRPEVRLVRVSLTDTRKEEEAIVGGPIRDFHVNLTPRQVGNLFRRGRGILFSPSDPGEGFGLPAVEAMACGIPTVLTDIPSYTSFSSPCDYALFVPHDDEGAMAEGILRLMDDKSKQNDLRKRGARVAAGFSFDAVFQNIEGVLG